MKKLVALFLSLCLVLGMAAVASADAEVKKASAQGFTGEVKVEVTVEDGKVTALTVDDSVETYTLMGYVRAETVEKLIDAIVAAGGVDGVDTVAGATVTQKAILEAVGKALADNGEPAAELAFTPGEYEVTAYGYNGNVTGKVTFSESKLEKVEIVSSMETGHVGTDAFSIMIPEMIEANGSGVDGVSGATFSGRALREIVNGAAEQAGCTNLDAFKSNKIEHTAGEPIEKTADVIVVGGGGAGMAAAAQATQNGMTVLVIEKNAEVGGNTLVSGGQFQSVMPYLVWDANDPDATEGVYGRTGEAHEKIKAKPGTIDVLKNILNWSEEPFDEEFYKTNEFVAGDDVELAKHGVHAEYLPVLQDLKKEIQAYLDWAQPKLDAGIPEDQLTLFSTLNLHIFQTYYGGLRQTADKSEWIYGNVDLVKQFVEDGQGLKEWLEDMGADFKHTQPTLIGALWYRENEYTSPDGNWTPYFKGPLSVIGEENVMTRTTATDLIVEDGKVVGVKAVKFDGTEVTARANKGVVLATGGYAANIDLVLRDNAYWDSAYLTKSTKTTNRSSQMGDGITMAQAVGADVTGMNFTQLMPISWVDNGNLAFGSGTYACWVSPIDGQRFVDEGSERDVLSLAEFRNGMELNGTPGVFIEFFRADQYIPGPPTAQLPLDEFEGRYYKIKCNEEELSKVLAKPEFANVQTDAATMLATVKAYDQAVIEKANTGSADFGKVGKQVADYPIGNTEKDENGKYLPETYDLDNTVVFVRLMAPSTHHTMGGIVVDTERHVLDTEGNIIPGLYAAGEVTGGIHGGNRLGGNAIVEIFVSGRTAANTIAEENK
ncbi:MAG: FAD-dependent oxidoreductase [Clostridia bacterium]|nr:FAD-dependent oxidoreductase [Clostridia bacterium]